MNYPYKKVTTIFCIVPWLFFWKKLILLKIPQGTIGEIDKVRQLDDKAISSWLITSLLSWGVPRRYVKYFLHFGKEKILKILEKTFFATHYVSQFPESVANLADKEEFQYNTPENVTFAVVAKNFGISPHKLLSYTYDELSYFLDALRYINLNDEQKAELSRLENVKNFSENKSDFDELFKELEK